MVSIQIHSYSFLKNHRYNDSQMEISEVKCICFITIRIKQAAKENILVRVFSEILKLAKYLIGSKFLLSFILVSL